MKKHKSKITLENKEMSKDNVRYISRFKKSMKAKGRTDLTVYNYTKDIEQFIQYIQKEVTDITYEDLKIFLDTCKEMGNSYKRLLRRYRVVSSYFKFLVDRKLVTEDITLHIDIKEYE